jgi:hypothetical protein
LQFLDDKKKKGVFDKSPGSTGILKSVITINENSLQKGATIAPTI